MKHPFKSSVVLFLCFVMLAVALIGCADNGSSPNNPNDSRPVDSDALYAEELAAVPNTSYDGAKFIIAMSTNDNEKWIEDIFFDEDDPETRVKKAVTLRNLEVMESHDIVMELMEVNGYDENREIYNAIMADAEEFNMVMPHANVSAMLAQSGCFLDWNILPHVNLEGEYWNQDARESLSINNKLFIMTGDISYLSVGMSNVLLFNKMLMSDIQKEYPYEAVRSGEWTFEMFESYIREGSRDLNGDHVIDSENDQLGYVTQMYVGPVQAFYSAGQRVLTKDEDDIPHFSLYTTVASDTFDWYFGILDSDYAYVQDYGNSWDGDFISTFRNSRSLFIDVNMYDIANLSDMTDDFGVVPWPKYDENGEYCANVDAGLHMMCIPIGSDTLEMTSVILEHLCILGARDVIKEYFEIAIQNRYTRDPESIEMLGIIKSAGVFDLGYYNSYYSEVFHVPYLTFVHSGARNYSSFYYGNIDAEQEGLNSLIESYQ